MNTKTRALKRWNASNLDRRCLKSAIKAHYAGILPTARVLLREAATKKEPMPEPQGRLWNLMQRADFAADHEWDLTKLRQWDQAAALAYVQWRRALALRVGGFYRINGVGEIVEFSRIGGTGLAIVHPPGEPDMQSSWAVDPARLVPAQGGA